MHYATLLFMYTPVKDFIRIHIGISDMDVWMGNSLGICKGKGTTIPKQAWTVPNDHRRLRLPDFKTIST
jgi:hypothetical protein